MERADWLEAGYNAAQARFLMLTTITHHRFDSPAWGEDEIRRLHAELAEIDATAARVLALVRGPAPDASSPPSGIYGLNRRRAPQTGWDEQQPCLTALPAPAASRRRNDVADQPAGLP